MTPRFVRIGLVFVGMVVPGCSALKKPQASPLTQQMSELQSALDNRQITLDEFERAKHDVVYATRQAPATKAR